MSDEYAGTKRKREPVLLRYEAVAEVLDVEVSFVKRLVSRGDLEAVALGHRTLRVLQRSLDQYLTRKKVTG